MTNEELQRLKQYTAKIEAVSGRLAILTLNERRDFEELLGKRIVENETQTNEPRLGTKA